MKTIRLWSILAIISHFAIWPLEAQSAAPATGNTTAKSAAKPENHGSEQFAQGTASASSIRSNYLLCPTDLLHVEIVEDVRATRDPRIDIDGTVRLAYLEKPIKLAGLSVSDAQQAIEKAYMEGEIFVKPQVSVTVMTYAERRVNIVGQVNRPGPVPIPSRERLFLVAAVSQAGGHTRLAAHEVTITRKLPDGKTQKFTADLKKAMTDSKFDVELEDGDTIYVDESMIGWL